VSVGGADVRVGVIVRVAAGVALGCQRVAVRVGVRLGVPASISVGVRIIVAVQTIEEGVSAFVIVPVSVSVSGVLVTVGKTVPGIGVVVNVGADVVVTAGVPVVVKSGVAVDEGNASRVRILPSGWKGVTVNGRVGKIRASVKSSVTVEGIWQASVRARNAMTGKIFLTGDIAYHLGIATSTFGFAVRQDSRSVPCS